MRCQVPGRQWQKACTASAGLGAKPASATNSTPEVPSDRKASPGADHPDPDGPGGVVARPAGHHRIGRHAPGGGDLGPQRAGRLAALEQLAAWPTSVRPVAASIASDQRRAPTSSHSVPAASDISEAAAPVMRRRR